MRYMRYSSHYRLVLRFELHNIDMVWELNKFKWASGSKIRSGLDWPGSLREHIKNLTSKESRDLIRFIIRWILIERALVMSLWLAHFLWLENLWHLLWMNLEVCHFPLGHPGWERSKIIWGPLTVYLYVSLWSESLPACIHQLWPAF